MSKYDEIVALAKALCTGTTDEAEVVYNKVKNFTGDDFVDVLETSREILHENSGDDELISKMNRFLELVATQYTKRLMNRD